MSYYVIYRSNSRPYYYNIMPPLLITNFWIKIT